MSYVTIQEDRFSRSISVARQEEIALRAKKPSRQSPVRRPLSGLEIKDDTYATLEIRDASGQTLGALKNTSTDRENLYETYTSNFSVEAITEQRNEKSQIIQTFGDDFIFFFGERPVQLNIALVLPDAKNFRWHQEFWENYSDQLRGTRVAQQETRAYFTLDDRIFEGCLLNANFSRQANTHNMVRVNITFLVTNTIWLKPLTNKVSILGPTSEQTQKFIRGTALAQNELTFNLLEQNIDPLQDLATAQLEDSVLAYRQLLASANNSYYIDARPGDYISLPQPDREPVVINFDRLDNAQISRRNRLRDSITTTDADFLNSGVNDPWLETDAPMRQRQLGVADFREPPSGWDQFLDALNYAASAVATAYYVAKISAVAFGALSGLASAIMDIHRTQGIPNYLGGLVVDAFDFTVVQPIEGIAGGTMDAYRAGFNTTYNVVQNNEMEPTPDPVINFGSDDASSDVTLIAGAASSPTEQIDPVL